MRYGCFSFKGPLENGDYFIIDVEGATLRISRGFLAHTILEISGCQLNPLRAFSLNIYRKV